MKKNKMWRYDTVSVILHWVIAIFILSLISMGLYMVSIENNPNSELYFNLHKSFGMTVAMLIIFKIIWRLNHKPEKLPNSTKYWQVLAAKSTHYLLYLCMFLMPTTGFIGSIYSKYNVMFFNLSIPKLVNNNDFISKTFLNIHGIVAWTLITLIIIHILAVIQHVFIKKDNVLKRMFL